MQHIVKLLATVGRPAGPFPAPRLPEIAFAGRSNVGKSSLINTILRRKNLARVSKRPGKTTTINIFEVDRLFHLADLPGYGFARVPASERARWSALVGAYLEARSKLAGVLHLVDGRHRPQPADLRMRDWLKHGDTPFLVVATKIDKVKRSQRRTRIGEIAAGLELPSTDHVLPVSSETKEGLRELMREIHTLIAAAREQPTPPEIDAEIEQPRAGDQS